MEITNVRIMKNESILKNTKLKGIASIIIDGAIAINNIGIVEGKKGVFLNFPSRKSRRGEYLNVAFPINNEARKKIEEAIMKVYNDKKE
ncbi:SpoVG family protein [Clostridium felsineum]|uniref:Septation protein SpoVG n=1 Tax=Clostridium felsineum TaxID=36839 RepID=A0A1S8LDC5_9CLOT|nr:SpoVG family protein [Clostridium felsineum]URZ05903.1 Putative septation protein SpoVG [Clostridium felsineum]URZ10940.1 Putative septation protein SpoVG [Clostridium felsineum]